MIVKDIQWIHDEMWENTLVAYSKLSTQMSRNARSNKLASLTLTVLTDLKKFISVWKFFQWCKSDKIFPNHAAVDKIILVNRDHLAGCPDSWRTRSKQKIWQIKSEWQI